jgi:aminotransferase
MASLDGMAERTVTINSVSKTFSVTGWRVGWTIGPAGHHRRHPQGARFSDGRRGRAAAGRRGCGAAPCPPRYYRELAAPITARADRLLGILVSPASPATRRAARTTS